MSCTGLLATGILLRTGEGDLGAGGASGVGEEWYPLYWGWGRDTAAECILHTHTHTHTQSKCKVCGVCKSSLNGFPLYVICDSFELCPC